MPASQFVRRGFIAVVMAATFSAGFAGAAQAEGGLMSIVAHGAEDVYVTPAGTGPGVIVDATGATIVDSTTGEVIVPRP